MKVEDPDQDYDDLMTALSKPHESKGKHLCWLNGRPQNLEIEEMRGYRPVTTSAADEKGGQAAKRLVQIGDSVLAALPIEVHEARQRKLAEKYRRQQQTVKQRHEEEMRKAARAAKVSEDLSTGDIQTEVTRR